MTHSTLSLIPHDSRLGRVISEAAARLARKKTSPSRPDADGGALVIPLNVGADAVLTVIGRDGDGQQIKINNLGAGEFIFGDDNAAFGRWNALVAHDDAGNVIDVFPGHGGEIIPGKLEDHVDRFRSNLKNRERLPVQMDIDISMACPSHCTFCFSAPYRAPRGPRQLMKKQVMLEVIRQFAAMGVKVVRFDGGGDPLSHPHLLEAIKLSNALGMRTAVLTAGDLLDERQLDTFVDCRTYVRVSLNAGTDATRLLLHRPHNSGMNLSRVLACVRKLSALRREAFGAAARSEMLIGATSMIHPANSHEAFLTALKAKDAGFDHLSFRVILGKDHRAYFTQQMRERLADDFQRIRAELVDESFITFTPTRELTDGGYIPAESFNECLSCTHRVLIEVGDRPEAAAQVPCGRYRGQGFLGADRAGESVVMGRYGDATPTTDVWMNPRMQQLVESFPSRCEDCIDKSANLFFAKITAALSSCEEARFLRLRRGERSA